MAICGIGELFCYQWISDSPMSKLCTSNIIFWSISETAENAGILIGILLAKKYYDAQVHLEKRKKEKKENELRLLRSQIDPHFLFNNLNTLDALIDKDPNLAKSYLNELSHLYRYLIRTKDDDVVLLKDELAFAKNYIFLIEKRFGNLFKFQIEGIENLKEQYIPPGALQVVIENVVKHNKGIVGKPLTTFLRIDKESVSISNEIRKKFETEESLGTGLKNLKARYSHLTEKKIKIEKSFNFKITLPTLAII